MKRHQIKQISNGIVNLFFITLILVSLIGGIQLILSNFQGLSGLGVKIVDAVLVVILIYIICAPVRKWVSSGNRYCLRFIQHYHMVYLWTFILLTLVWQVAVVMLMSGDSNWDSGLIIKALIGDLPGKSAYFSHNPNTISLMFLERRIWLISGQPGFQNFVLILNFINIFLIDSAVLLTGNVAKNWFGGISQKLLFTLSWFLIVMSPWTAMPYSDIWAFFLTALTLYLIDQLSRQKQTNYKFILAFCLGLVIVMSYYIKPSLIITGIAAIIVLLFKSIEDYKFVFNRTMLVSLCLVLIGAGGGILANHSFLSYQDFVKIDRTQAHPLTHFMAIGMQDDGGFYRPYANLDLSIKSPTKRNQANIKLIHARLRQFNGLTNYQKFLVQKQINNTSDGSFGWGQEGDFLYPNHGKNQQLNRTLVRRLFVKNGAVRTNNFEYRFVAQLFWVSVLIGLVGAAFLDDWKVQLLKYTVVGFMLFLLIFEGGRSRYVIQFLPVMLMLAAVGGRRLFELIHLNSQKNCGHSFC